MVKIHGAILRLFAGFVSRFSDRVVAAASRFRVRIPARQVPLGPLDFAS